MCVCVSLFLPGSFSTKSRPDESPQVPHVPAVLLAGLPARPTAAVRGAGPASRRGVTPPAAGPAPPREAVGARSRRRRQNQERPPEPHRVHRAAAHGPGETLREAKVSLYARQVRFLGGSENIHRAVARSFRNVEETSPQQCEK